MFSKQMMDSRRSKTVELKSLRAGMASKFTSPYASTQLLVVCLKPS